MDWSAQLAGLSAAIEPARRVIPRRRALLAGISGIDGSGKSTIAPLVAQQLNARGLRTALVPLDEWHNPPALRFHRRHPAEAFYARALRLEELFAQLVLPLQQHRSARLQTSLLRLPEEISFRHTFAYDDVDVILLEGIFIFKKQFQGHFDFRCWVECPFDVALARALRRNQEGMPPETIARDYQTIYFPAQRLHFSLDRPMDGADLVLHNGAHAPAALPARQAKSVAAY